MEQRVRYPIGQQSFEIIRGDGLLYVDKTKFVDRIVNSGSQYCFLGRPRRFGKSLFLSTLDCFFQGRRELFKGLYIDSTEWEWKRHPVLYFDFNVGTYHDESDLDILLDNLLRKWEKEYGVDNIAGNMPVRLSNIIEAAYKATGRRVVILVDEYDKPLVNSLHNREAFVRMRDRLTGLYSNFKSSAKYLRLVFLTGVSRFAHLSIFSGLNNINDISFDDAYSDICGITEAELIENFKPGIAGIAAKLKISEDEVFNKIKRWYDGYHFSAYSPDIYNPFSLLNLMDKGAFRNYWIKSGQPTLLLNLLKIHEVNLKEVVNKECNITELEGIDFDNISIESLLFQTGYLTIKEYKPMFDRVKLGMPNLEVNEGFLSFLLPAYTRLHQDTSSSVILKFVEDLLNGDDSI